MGLAFNELTLISGYLCTGPKKGLHGCCEEYNLDCVAGDERNSVNTNVVLAR